MMKMYNRGVNMFYQTMADHLIISSEKIIKFSLFIGVEQFVQQDEIYDPAVKQNCCRSEEYDIEKNKKNSKKVKNRVSITELFLS